MTYSFEDFFYEDKYVITPGQATDRHSLGQPTGADGTLVGHSAVLGLNLCWQPPKLRLFDPATGAWLLDPDDLREARRAAEVHAGREAAARKAAEVHAGREAAARRAAEAHVTRETAARKAAEEELAALRRSLASSPPPGDGDE